MVSVLATLKAGAAYIPIEPSFPPDLVEFMVSDSLPAVIITTSKHAPKFEKTGAKLIKLDDKSEAIRMQSAEKPDVDIAESGVAYGIYTSGSTGKRKAALIEHKSIVNQCHAWQDAYQITEKDGVLQTASFSFDVFTGDWTRTFVAGAKLVLNPYNLIFSPDDNKSGEKLYRLIKDNRVTVAEFTPPVLRKLIRYARNVGEPLGFMRLIIVGADSWYMNEHRELIELTQGQSRIVNSYGMTEATVDSTYYEGYGTENDGNVSLIGKPFMNTEIFVLDDKDNIVPVGEKGELCVAGPGLTRGYLNRPDLNEERFGEVVFPDGSVKRIYRSGDLVRFRDDGNLEFLGRMDNQVELGAIRVEIGEIEGVIQKHPAIQENSIIVVEDEEHNKKVVCFMVINPSQSVTDNELKEFLADKLPGYMWPSQIHILDSMPLTTAGKIDRKTLTSLTKK
jgi:amino acid adenylation domain-containing protein